MDKTTATKRAPRFLLAMPDAVRVPIEAAAHANNRTVTAEINGRLRASLNNAPPPASRANPYTTDHTPTVATTNDNGPAGAISDTDRAMLEIFRKLPVEKQLALLSLFR